jgi:hypothetical protein
LPRTSLTHLHCICVASSQAAPGSQTPLIDMNMYPLSCHSRHAARRTRHLANRWVSARAQRSVQNFRRSWLSWSDTSMKRISRFSSSRVKKVDRDLGRPQLHVYLGGHRPRHSLACQLTGFWLSYHTILDLKAPKADLKTNMKLGSTSGIHRYACAIGPSVNRPYGTADVLRAAFSRPRPLNKAGSARAIRAILAWGRGLGTGLLWR